MWKFALVGIVLMIGTGCETQQRAKTVEPPTEAGARTGKVSNIVINESVTPATLTVNAGDEVRWLNHRQRPVVVQVAEPLDGRIACRNGFSKALAMGVENETTIDPNETAGLCFSRLGTVRYSVRSDDTDDPQPLQDTQGTITVE
ncbi:hypothetical protein YTPLAS18_15290 [Nitrospira sp.]|nr:hypothetical protein YTPLAS18_15290 [Nitrospira sp.]